MREEVCPDCDGAGDLETTKGYDVCTWCDGTGLLKRKLGHFEIIKPERLDESE